MLSDAPLATMLPDAPLAATMPPDAPLAATVPSGAPLAAPSAEPDTAAPAPHPGLLAAGEYAEWLENVCPCAEATELGRIVADFRRGHPLRDAGAERALRLLSGARQIAMLRMRLEKPGPTEPDLLTVVRSLEPQAAAALGWFAAELADHARLVGESAAAAADDAVVVALSEEERANADRALALSLAEDGQAIARAAAADAEAVADAADAAEQDRATARIQAEARMRPRDGRADDDSEGDDSEDDAPGPATPPPRGARWDMPPAGLLRDFDSDSGSDSDSR